VTTDHLRAYFAALHENISERTGKRLSPFTTHGNYRSINTFWRWTHTNEYIAHNPMERVRPPRTPKRIIKRLSERQLLILLDEIQRTAHPTRNRAMLLLMLDSGLRRGETVNLTIYNIHTAEKFVDVKGKGEKERRIPISAITAQAIDAWISERPKTRCKQLFVKASGKPITGECIRAILRRINNRMKLERLYPHLLRHTFAKLYLKRGNLNTLAQILGHADIKTTAEIYVGDADIDDLIEEHRRASPLSRLRIF